MSEKKRQSFSADFKAKVALEAIHSVKTLNEISQEYGVHPVQVSTWKKELQQQASTLFVQKDFGTSHSEKSKFFFLSSIQYLPTASITL